MVSTRAIEFRHIIDLEFGRIRAGHGRGDVAGHAGIRDSPVPGDDTLVGVNRLRRNQRTRLPCLLGTHPLTEGEG